jgi:hypothetical protein
VLAITTHRPIPGQVDPVGLLEVGDSVPVKITVRQSPRTVQPAVLTIDDEPLTIDDALLTIDEVVAGRRYELVNGEYRVVRLTVNPDDTVDLILNRRELTALRSVA